VKKHSTDLVSLVFGLAFAALVAWWAVAHATDTRADGRWLLVGVLGAVGVVILVSTLVGRGPSAPVPAPAEPDAAMDEPAGPSEPSVESPTAVLDADPAAVPRTDDPYQDQRP
jgi:hypothetical protein